MKTAKENDLLIKELYEAQDDYIKILEKALKSAGTFLYMHNQRSSEEEIKKSVDTREKIKILKDKLFEKDEIKDRTLFDVIENEPMSKVKEMIEDEAKDKLLTIEYLVDRGFYLTLNNRPDNIYSKQINTDTWIEIDIKDNFVSLIQQSGTGYYMNKIVISKSIKTEEDLQELLNAIIYK